MTPKKTSDLRRRVYLTLEQGLADGGIGLTVDRFLIALILVNLVNAALESVPSLSARFGPIFHAVEYVSLGVFTLEYLLRLWTAVDHGPYRHLTAARARIKYALSATGVIDFLAVLPFWLEFVVAADLRFVLVLRMVRFFKIARYTPAMRSLFDVIYRERRALFGCMVMTAGATLVAASVMHLVEGHVQPDKLGTIPDAMWWAIVTIGTIGYGDVIPVTPLGKLVATGTIFVGVMMIALPVGIIATAFSEQIHRREFIVTWSMIARVPLFSELDAGQIANVMELLRAQVAEAGQVIVREGDAAHSMYFIAAGRVEVALKDREPVMLGPGQFFGEVAVLRRARRSATATALSRTSLLVLDAQDLHTLMNREPRLAERVHDVVRTRLGEPVTPKGDIAEGEVG